jgi:hypothetical protein
MFLLSMRYLISDFCDWQQLYQAVADPPMGFFGLQISVGGMDVDFMALPGGWYM